MNIFCLDVSPVKSAQLQCDRHVVKMIVESGQMLSTTHRLLDGTEVREAKTTSTGKVRSVKVWHIMSDPIRNKSLYAVTHPNHPCTLWTRQSSANYRWHYEHFCALCNEYTHRYGRVHATDAKLRELLATPPNNLPEGPLTPFVLCMGSRPECIDEADPVGSYKKFYMTKQGDFKMAWTKREVPEWFNWLNAPK